MPQKRPDGRGIDRAWHRLPRWAQDEFAALRDAEARLAEAADLQRDLARLATTADTLARQADPLLRIGAAPDEWRTRAECYGAAAVRLSMVLDGTGDPVATSRRD